MGRIEASSKLTELFSRIGVQLTFDATPQTVATYFDKRRQAEDGLVQVMDECAVDLFLLNKVPIEHMLDLYHRVNVLEDINTSHPARRLSFRIGTGRKNGNGK